MADKRAAEEEMNMVFFQDLYDSPAKSEASSVDIYDGLDISSIPAEPSILSTPTRDCLDLYEEILTEEVTAKEASFNDLHAEYEKCQKQMKELINRVKEMQTQNTTLQNENQCLKKNISALIKTARVEINRKEDEINRLNQRFSSVNPRINKHIPVPLSEPNKTSYKTCQIESRSREIQPKNTDSSGKPDLQNQTINSRRNDSTRLNYLPTEKDINAVDKNFSSSSNPCAKLSKGLETELLKENTEGYSNQDAAKGRKERYGEDQSKDRERRQMKEQCRSSSSSLVCEKKTVELKETGPSSDSGKSESRQETQATKFDSLNEKNNRKFLTSTSHDKARTMRDKAPSKEDSRTKEKLRKPSESYSRRDSKDSEKGKDSDYRNRKTEKDDPPRRSQRTSNLKDESSSKSKAELDRRRSSDTSRREKHSSDYSKVSKSGHRDCNLIGSSKNEHKMSSKKEDKHILDHKNMKSGRDKDERKGSREKEDKDERKGSREKEGSYRDRKEHKVLTGEGKQKEVSSDMHSSKVKSSCKSDDQCKLLNAEKLELDQKKTNTVKDLKLSYMETLHLTLSPAKKKSLSESDTSKLPLVLCDEKHGIGEITNPKPVLQLYESSASINEVKSASSQKSKPESIILTENPPKQVTTSNINLEEDKKCQSKQVVDAIKCTPQNQPGIPIDESNPAPSNTTLSVADPEKVVVNNELHALHSDEMETSIADGSQIIDLDSYIELDKCSGSESPHSEKEDEDNVAQTVFCQENLSPSKQLNKAFEHNTNILKNVTEPAKGICESTNLVEISTKEIESKQCLHDDDDSVMNIDLHFIRRVPKIISPLKSPMKPIVKLHRIDYTAKASVVRLLNKEFCYANGTSSVHLSKELNKENFQPAVKNDASSAKCSPIIISSDDMEEGEIVSDVEEVTCVQAPNTTSSPKQTAVVQTNINEDSVSFQRDDTSMGKPNRVISSRKQNATKSKVKSKSDLKTHLLKQPNKKRRIINPDNCLEEILQADKPSSIQDVLQMLRAIRKHIRKKYMKFKMQFTVRQYHKVIEVGTSYFITLVKKVNWTALCSLPSTLQKKLCKYIDNKMKKLKKNGIVDRIFEQHLLDMKKKLWNFVDDQLDCLFDTLKIMLTKLCDKAELECTSDKNHLCVQNNISSSSARLKGSKINNKIEQENHKTTSFSEIQCKAQVPKVKDQNNKPVSNSVNKDSLSREPVKGPVVVESDSKSNILIEKNLKPALSGTSEIRKLEPDRSGLSFNLVSDDHMGDIFKNLLNDLEALEQTKTSDEKSWVFRTPEKPSISSQKNFSNENTPIKTCLQLPSSLSWPPHSPMQSSSFSTLDMVVNPDVLDESCMLEIPLTSSSGKSIPGSDERLKSYSSILMEDLAVSLTVPSPLKSDSHLSFLRLGTAPEYVSEEVINTNYSEGALLEEDDVAEQDIHLTLDSDNSNSSLENTNDISSFQCLPSEPMQAVIMEKSNDHFIVKIRRASSTFSPNSEQPSTEHFPPVPESTTDVKDLADHLKNINFEEHESHGGNSPPKSEHKVFQVRKSDATHKTVDGEILETSLVNVSNKAVDFKQLPDKDVDKQTVSLFKPPEPLSPSKDSTLVSTSQANLHQIFQSVTDRKDCNKSDLFSEQVTKDSIICNSGSPESIAQVNWNDKAHRTKRKKESKEEPLAKRRQVQSFNQESNEKKAKEYGKEQSNILSKGKSQRKHKRSASDCTDQLSSSPKDSSKSMSAKNVIKKKGEIVTTWSRDDDRLILLHCQQLGADQKTFISLSSKMNKPPHEIAERFRQLMKLFKKCRYSAT
ncbi:CASP8-associated protein 2 isoform X3 [Xenopus laevis]|uniref:CASP8-associated protein 2 n=1 Tax=Xenopus laevis TaxID=8355 RepID=A0A8J0VFL1_XENLA|nr:CASP8-associated protein 2 isoform X3 [Xenopus laevis]XP_018120926.1 CASP8-associated protein 2 isoform X3 [Xenopus laevis]